MPRSQRPKGYVIWEGLSPLDNKPLVAIAIMQSTNTKTGNMVQVYILRSDINPVEAVNNGEDFSICGDCPHRKNTETGKRSCYVNVGQGPNAVYKAFKADKYPRFSYAEHGNVWLNKSIRFGAYGDPALLPEWLVKAMIGLCQLKDAHTGYTHQWRRFQNFAGIFMASCETEHERLAAQSLGFKTFSVIHPDNHAPNYAKQCPATVTNSRAKCETCKLCDGLKLDIFVTAHGSGKNYVNNHDRKVSLPAFV